MGNEPISAPISLIVDNVCYFFKGKKDYYIIVEIAKIAPILVKTTESDHHLLICPK